MPMTRAELDARIDAIGYPIESDGSSPESTRIEKHVWDIYQTPTGKKMIDDWLANPANAGKNIEFNFSNDNAAAYPNTGKVLYDEDFDTANGNFTYLDKTGVAIDEKDVGTIAHELVHALTGKTDTWVGQDDYSGDTVTEANKIFKELKLKEQLSYPGASSQGNLVVGTNYSDGRDIDRAWVDSTSSGSGTHSSTGDHRDLLVGGKSDNTFNAGAGNDVLRGQGGKDTLNGEAGDDLIYGGKGKDLLIGGAGADKLNGGDGKDILYGGDKTTGDNGAIDTLTGGKGNDTYHVGKGDIINADQDGSKDKIFLDGVKLTGPGTDGKGADGATYVLNDDTLTVTLKGSSITIKDFDDSKFGFKMPETEKTIANRSAETPEAEDATILNTANISGSDVTEMPMKEALTVLRDESDEALRLSPSVGLDEDVSPMLNSSAAVSVMQTLVDNEQASIPVSQKTMDGTAYDRVREILKGSVDRLSDIDKTHEAEALYNDLQNVGTHTQDSYVYNPAPEDEISYEF